MKCKRNSYCIISGYRQLQRLRYITVKLKAEAVGGMTGGQKASSCCDKLLTAELCDWQHHPGLTGPLRCVFTSSVLKKLSWLWSTSAFAPDWQSFQTGLSRLIKSKVNVELHILDFNKVYRHWLTVEPASSGLGQQALFQAWILPLT